MTRQATSCARSPRSAQQKKYCVVAIMIDPVSIHAPNQSVQRLPKRPSKEPLDICTAIIATRRTVEVVLFYATIMRLGAWVMTPELLDVGAGVMRQRPAALSHVVVYSSFISMISCLISHV